MYQAMNRATEARGARACALVIAAFGFVGVHAQTIGDYSRSQRAVLEAEMARSTARAMAASGSEGRSVSAGGGGGLPSPLTQPPAVAMPAPPPLPSMPLGGLPQSGLAVTGLIALPDHAMIELTRNGETMLLASGDAVPGTSWVVASIDEKRVVLKSGNKSNPRTRILAVPAGGR